MLTVYILATMQLTGASLDTVKARYEQCVVAQTVTLGAANQESADTILRAVRFKCEPAWQQLTDSFPSGSGVPIAEQARSDALAKWRSDAEGAAIIALLEARHTR